MTSMILQRRWRSFSLLPLMASRAGAGRVILRRGFLFQPRFSSLGVIGACALTDDSPQVLLRFTHFTQSVPAFCQSEEQFAPRMNAELIEERLLQLQRLFVIGHPFLKHGFGLRWDRDVLRGFQQR